MKKHVENKRNDGFTLIELAITMAVLSIIMLIMYQILNFNVRLVKSEDMRLQYVESARTVLNQVMKKIREADAANVEFDSATGDIKAGGNIIFNVYPKDVNYSNSALWYKKMPGEEFGYFCTSTGNVLAGYIRSLDVQTISDKYLRLTLKTGKDEIGAGDYVLCIPLSKRGTSYPGDKAIKVQMYNVNYTNPSSSAMQPNFKIINIGSEPINISDIKIRYYFTTESDKTLIFECHWAQLTKTWQTITNSVANRFVIMTSPVIGATHYAEIGFTNTDAVLMPGQEIEMHVQIHKQDWSSFAQGDDYSFNSTASGYIDWPRVTGYINGILSWGVEPSGTPPSNYSIRVLAYNFDRNDSTTDPAPFFKIENTGDVYIDLSEITIHYYYTIDGEKPQTSLCDYAAIANFNSPGGIVEPIKQHIITSNVKMKEPCYGADYYLNVGFASGVGRLAPGQFAFVECRFYKNDRSLYIQTDDYSFNKTAENYVLYNNITAYRNGVLIQGVEPTPLPPDAIAYFTFNNNTNDLTKYENHGYITPVDKHDTAVLKTAPGHDGEEESAIYLDGTYYIRIPSSESLDSISDALTIDLWCMPLTKKDNNKLEKMTVLDRTHGSKGYELYLDKYGRLHFATTEVKKKFFVPDPIPFDEWTHIRVTYDNRNGLGRITIYIGNNEQPLTPVVIVDAGDYDIDNKNDSVYIGATHNGVSSNASDPFYGYLDDVIIWNSIK